MSKYVVVVLPDEKKAFQALSAIKDLHSEGMVTLYGAGVVERKQDGKLEVKQAADQGPLGLAAGSLIGGLVGLFGGPVGAAVGLGTGALLGSWRDYINMGVSQDFVESITHEISPGRFAVIAEVSEDWVTPIDAKMEALGAKVVREYRDDFVDDMIEKRADSVRSELDQRKAEHRSTGTPRRRRWKRSWNSASTKRVRICRRRRRRRASGWRTRSRR
jgi:uncharacterized membrane protein